MTIRAEQLAAIDAVLKVADAGAELRAALLARWPELSVTEVHESDVDTEEPYRSYPGWLLYFIDHQHCRQIVNDPARASGLVLARRRRTTA